MRKILLIFLIIFLFFLSRDSFSEINKCLKLNKNDRIIIFAPHPDDETIGAAGVIQRALKLKIPLKVVYYTNGDHNQLAFIVYDKRLVLRKKEFIRLGEVRRKEAVQAMQLAGLNKNQLIFLGYPDFGTLNIFTQYWGNMAPFKSILTRVNHVPYKECLSYKAPYKGESILKDIETILINFRPTKVFVTGPFDTNNDHRSLYLFLKIALWDLEGKIKRPRLYIYLIHYPHWPEPRGFHPDLNLEPPERLTNQDISWMKLELTPGEVKKKKEMISCYKSQIEYNPPYLYTFARKNELFGVYSLITLEKETNKIDWGKLETSENIKGEVIDEKNIKKRNIKFVTYAQKDGDIYINLKLKKWISKITGISIYLIGYKKGFPFARMPKFRIYIKEGKRMIIYERRNPVFIPGASFKFQGKELEIKFPLSSMEYPDYILSSAKTHMHGIPYEATTWRILKPGYE